MDSASRRKRSPVKTPAPARAERSRRARALTELDWRIIDLLRENGRHQNKELANLLGVSEPTIASRIKRLRADGVMLVTVQEDIYSQGFDFQCIAQIAIEGRDAQSVAQDLAKLAEVTVVTLQLGTPEILIVFNARDRAHMIELINQKVARVKGIIGIEADIALTIAKYESSFANLANPYAEYALSSPKNPADLDQKIIASLQPDGRLSNREIARRLNVSEATVRQRLKRLQNDRKIRIGVVVDAVKTGRGTSAWIRAVVAPRYLDQALRRFSQIEEVTYVGETTGAYNVLLVMFGRNQVSLMHAVNSEIRNLRGVQRLEARIMAQTIKHNYFEVAISRS